MSIESTRRPPHTPMRTCIVCRVKKAKGSLLRLALDKEGFVVVDLTTTMEGRGAYVCSECFRNVKWNKRLGRAFLGRARGLGEATIARSLRESYGEGEQHGTHTSA